MRDIDPGPCPHCGFSPDTYQKPPNACSCGTILDGRYLAGEARAVGTALQYSAFDLQLEKAVTITAFPGSADAVNGIPAGTHVLHEFRENQLLHWVTEGPAAPPLPDAAKNSGKQPPKKTKSPKKPKKKRPGLWIGITAAAVAVSLAGGFLIHYLNQVRDYQAATADFEAELYADAAQQFRQLEGFRDAEAMALSAEQHLHYEAGLEEKGLGNYENAIVEFSAAPDIPGVRQQSGECWFNLGTEHLKSGAYDKAMTAFASAKEYPVPDAAAYYTYADGLQDLNQGRFDTAAEKLSQNLTVTRDFQSALDAYDQWVNQLLTQAKYTDAEAAAKKYAGFCEEQNLPADSAQILTDNAILGQAESYFDAGYLTQAQDTFLRASDGASYNDISRNDRLAILSRHSKLLNMEGDWIPVSGKSTLTSGRVIYYYNLQETDQLPFSVRFLLSDDGSITATGSCTWLSCASLITTTRQTFQFSCQVSLNNLHLTHIESIRTSVTMTYNQNKDTLSVGFTADDGTSVQYVYEKGTVEGGM